MAKKENIGFLERHLEKFVLGATAAVLAVVLIFWVGMSPRKVELSASEKYSPQEVDAKLLERALQVKATLERKNPEEAPVPDYPRLLESIRLTPFDAANIHPYIAMTPSMPPITGEDSNNLPPGVTFTLAQLTPLPQPGRPDVRIEREVQVLSEAVRDRAAVRQLREVVAAHGAGVYPVKELREKWQSALVETSIQPNFIVVAVEVERRQALHDGNFTQSQTLPQPRHEVLPKYDKDKKNLDEVLRAIEELKRESVQREIVEPNYPDIIWPDQRFGSWTIDKPKTELDDMVIEGSPDASPSAPLPMELPPPSLSPRGAITPPAPTAVYAELPPPPYPPTGRNQPPPMPPRPTTPRPATPRPRTVTPLAGAASGGAAEPVLVAAKTPSWSQQTSIGLLEAWFHDTEDLVPGNSYQYRYRLMVVNPLFGYFRYVAKDHLADAEQLTLATPWSQWSAPRTVKWPTEFFIAGYDGTQQVVKVDVFRQKNGQWVKGQFNVTRGQPIGGPQAVDVRTAAGGTEKTIVDFSTGATVVDLDFARKYRVGAGMERTTVEMLYLDPGGQLRARARAEDEASPQYRKLDAASRAGENVRIGT